MSDPSISIFPGPADCSHPCPVSCPHPHPHLKAILDFAADFAATMFGSGASTMRVVRCTRRVTESLGVEIEMSSTLRHFTISCRDCHTGQCTSRVVTVPELPVSFERTSDLSTLSWQAHDEQLSLAELRSRFDYITSRPLWNPLVVLLLISVANACFCRLFGGDLTAMAMVFAATMAGFALKKLLMGYQINTYLIVVGSAFVASICASAALFFDCTAQTAIATSPLFLVPGVPLINGVIDMVEGHILVGFSRIVNAMMLILCIAIGLSATLMLVKGSIL